MAPETPATRCRPGDLAIVVACEAAESGADLGKIVRIVGPGFDWAFMGDSRVHWCCDTLGQRFEVTMWPDPRATISDANESIDIPDAFLRPIRGGEQAESVDDAAPVHVGGVAA